MRGFTGMIRAGLAIAALVVVIGLAISYLGEYRAAQRPAEEPPASEVGTSTGEPTATPGQPAKPGKAPASKPGTKSAGKTVTVKIDGLNFRVEPKAVAEVYRGLDEGEVLTWLETREGWYKVRDATGREGWISANEQYVTLSE